MIKNKGDNEIISQALIILIVTITVGLIITVLIPFIGEMQSKIRYENSIKQLDLLDQQILEIINEPIGSTKQISLNLSQLYLNIDNNKVEIYSITNNNSSFFKDGLRVDEGNKYRYREGQKIVIGISYSNISFSNSINLENKNNITLILKKTHKDRLSVAQEYVTRTEWYNPSSNIYSQNQGEFEYRKLLLINSSKVDGDLENFPVLIDLEDEDLKLYAKEDGSDIIFTDENGTKLKREIENYNFEHSNLIVWVKLPYLSSTKDTPIYMYFGNSLANESNDKETWDNYYKTVMHFNEIVAVNNTPGFLDSTTNNNTGTLKLFDFDETSNTGVTGKIGSSVLLDGLDDYIQITQPTIGDNITYSQWINKKFTNSRRATKSGNGTSDSDYIIQYIEDNFRIYLGGGTPTPGYHGTSNGGIKTNDWSYITWSYDKSQLKLYVDGDLKRTIDVSKTTGIGNNPLYLGLYYGCGPPTCYENFLGNFDELRISNTIRSPEWIKTKYNNQSDPQSFINIGLLEKQ